MKIKDLPKELQLLKPFFYVAVHIEPINDGYQMVGRQVYDADDLSLIPDTHFWFCTERAWIWIWKKWNEKKALPALDLSVLSVQMFYEAADSLRPSKYRFVFEKSGEFEIFHSTDIKETAKEDVAMKTQVGLGSPEWPDDVVLFHGVGSLHAYFPDYSIGGYSTGFGGKLPILHIEEYARESLNFYVDKINQGDFARSHPEFERWFVTTPEQAFARLGIFTHYLGEKYGLGGYGGESAEDLMELRKTVYQQWLRQKFPHLFKEKVEPEVKKDEFSAPSLATRECVVCDEGNDDFVCEDCKPRVKIEDCGCIREIFPRGLYLWVCPPCSKVPF